MAALLAVGGIAVALALLGVALIVLFLISGRTAAARSQGGQQFWTLYKINDRIYRDPSKKKRLAWSQERFRHHRFRWQSDP